MAFVGHYTFFPSAHVRSCAFPGFPVHFRELYMNQNRPLLEIISQYRTILCITYGLGSYFVVDSPLPSVLNDIASNQP